MKISYETLDRIFWVVAFLAISVIFTLLIVAIYIF